MRTGPAIAVWQVCRVNHYRKQHAQRVVDEATLANQHPFAAVQAAVATLGVGLRPSALRFGYRNVS